MQKLVKTKYNEENSQIITISDITELTTKY